VASLVPILIPSHFGSLGGIFAVLLSSPWIQVMDKIIPLQDSTLSQGLTRVLIGGGINAALIYFVSNLF
jgi:hypothetical protein